MRLTHCALMLAGLATLMSHAAMSQARPRLINPPGLSVPRGYSHLAEVPPGERLLFISGQVPLDSAGRLVGPGDFRAQAQQVFSNLQTVLEAAGANFADVVKLNYYIVDISNLSVLREVRDEYVNTAAPPASTLAEVKGLFREGVLLEVEAIAVVPAR